MLPRTQFLRTKAAAVAITLALSTLAPAFAGSPVPVDSTWSVNNDGNWTVSANWSNGVPNAPGSTARFSGDTLSVINVSDPVTVGRILISGDTSYTYGGSTIAFNNTGGDPGDARISSDGGNHVFSTPLDIGLFTNLDISMEAGSITFNGAIGGPISNVDIFGPGTVLFNAANSLSQPVTVNNATLGGTGSFSGLVIASFNGTIAPSATLSAASTATLTMTGLSTGAGGTLAFHLVSPGAASVNDKLVVNQSGGLTLNGGSIAITATSTGAASLGYYKAIQYSGAINGTGINSLTLPAAVGNVVYTLDTIHDPGFIDIHRGFLGDANDDGSVTFADFVTLANNFGQSNTGWSGADFNNDGGTTFSDFIILANHFGQTISGGALTATPDELAAMNAFAAAHAAPEPASLTILTGAPLFFLVRRRPIR
jgi:hypothetical protein